MKQLILALLITGCADTQGPVERSRSIGSDWKEFGKATMEDIGWGEDD